MRVDEAAANRIAAAVTEAEKRTAGEIVVVVTDRSASFDAQRAVFASVLSTLAVLSLALLVPGAHASWVALVAVATFAGAWLITLAPPVVRRIVPRHDLDEAVERAAKLAFLDRGVHRTRDRSGVLVFLSLLEHRVQILGDEGVHRAVGEDGWKRYVGRILDVAAAGRIEDLASVVADIGLVLARTFPRRADDVNELPDQVVVRRA